MSSEVLDRRVRRHHLARRAPAEDALRVVADVAGLHAQLPAAAELALWARVDGLRPGAVDRLLWEDRLLVRTWAMRGTIHLLPAAELPVYTAAQQRLPPRHHGAAWLRHHGLTREQAEAMLAAIPAALDGPPLSREELAGEVARRTGHDVLAGKLTGGFGDLLKPAAFRGDLCFAPPDGRRVRFTRPDRWLGPQEPVDPAAGAAAVTRRWLAAYGPGTREHLARWFGMSSPAEAGRWLDLLRDDAVPVDVEGRSGRRLRDDATTAGDPGAAPGGVAVARGGAVEVRDGAVEVPGGAPDVRDGAAAARGAPAGGGPADGGEATRGVVRLLPAFDPYVVGAPRDSAAVLAPEHRAAVHQPQGWISPVLLVGGRIAGTWRHEAAGRRLAVRVAPFAAVGPAVRTAVEEEAVHLAAFLGGALDLSWEA